jgi:two-component system chemotaxis response regulator CheY
MNGNELVAHIRNDSNQRDVPVIMVTTEHDPQKLMEVYQLGVSAVCNKSFDPALVRNIVIQLFA